MSIELILLNGWSEGDEKITKVVLPLLDIDTKLNSNTSKDLIINKSFCQHISTYVFHLVFYLFARVNPVQFPTHRGKKYKHY